MPIQKNVNKDFFKIWSPDMAYILGFFFADGTITHNKNGSVYFVLQIADKELLESVRSVMRSEHKIAKRVHKKDGSIFFRLQIGSREIISDLAYLGVTPQKTKRMQLPNIPNEYLGSFVRGYFDGDGNVWTGDVHKERATKLHTIQTVFTSCSQEFLHALQYELEKNGIYGSCNAPSKKNVFRLQYSVKSSILLFRLMYICVLGGLFLERKRCVFEDFLKQRKHP
jgi:intein-encoded DNA endonuclease-like protein